MLNISVDSTKSDAISELDRRLKNPFWSGFVLAWITWNWRVWYLTFFVSESLVGNKIAEIQRMYEYFGWNSFPGFLLNWIIIPLCISGMITFWLPKLTDKFLQKQKKNKENEDIILRANRNEETETTKANIKLLKAQKEELEALRQKLKAENDAEIEKRTQEKLLEYEKPEHVIWDEEYAKLVKRFPEFWKPLSDLIYKYEGYSKQVSDIGGRIFDPGEIELLDTMGLIKANEKNNTYFQMTDKGRFFLRRNSFH